MFLDPYLLSVLVFALLIVALIVKDRRKIERKVILFIRRTEKGRDLIDMVVSISPQFWKKVGALAAMIGFGGMIFGTIYIFLLIRNAISRGVAAQGISLVIPVPFNEPAVGTGFIGVPFWYWIISIALLVVVHEGMHGVILRAHRIKIKSIGLLLLAIIPGAFVEPDEKDLKRRNWFVRLKVYAAGSFGNFLLAGLVFLILQFWMVPAFYTSGVGFSGYFNGTEFGHPEPYPAQKVNLTGVILEIDGERIRNFEDLSRFLGSRKPGDRVTVVTNTGEYSLTLERNPDGEGGFLGIANIYNTNVLRDDLRGTSTGNILEWIFKLLVWVVVLNAGIGVVNLLPLKPLDGGLMLETFMERFFPEYAEDAVRFSSAFILTLIISYFLFTLLV